MSRHIPLIRRPRIPTRSGWVLVALAAHTSWGAYPVLARYLQVVSDLPTMSLIVTGNIFVFIALALVTFRRLDPRVFRSPILWMFALVVVSRAITNLLAVRFTQAIYVQLITLMTPFLVAFLSATLLHDRIPPYTGRATATSLIGALLMMSKDLTPSNTKLALSSADGIGIALALASSLFLALYMILVRRAAQHNISGEALLITQMVTIISIATILSLLLGEDWHRWQALSRRDWYVFAGFVLGVLVGGNVTQISALQHLGAPLVSSLLAWRLVSALAFGALLLGERLTSVWQVTGALIVLVTITWYLRQQRGRE